MQLFSNIRHGGKHQNTNQQQPQLHSQPFTPLNNPISHRRSSTKQSYSESEFSNTGSTSSYTSTDSYTSNNYKNNIAPNTNKQIPIALRPNLDNLTNHNSNNTTAPYPTEPKHYTHHNQFENVNTSPDHHSTRESSISPIKLNSILINESNVPITDENIETEPRIQSSTETKESTKVNTPNKTQPSQFTQDRKYHQQQPESSTKSVSPKYKTPSPDGSRKNIYQNTPTSAKPTSYYKQNPNSRQSINSEAYNQQLYFGYQQPPQQLSHNYNQNNHIYSNPVSPQQHQHQQLQQQHQPTIDHEQDADTESDDDDDASSNTGSFQPTQHPYYEQWKMYYQALAFQQQQAQQQQMRQPMFYPNQNQVMPYNYQQMMQMPYMFNNPNAYMIQQQQFQQQQLQQQQMQTPQYQQTQPKSKNRQPSSSNMIHQSQSLQNVYDQTIGSNSHITKQQQKQQKQQQNLPSSNSEPNLPNSINDSSETFLKAYQKSRKLKNKQLNDSTDELIQNSRKCNLKSNRFASEPQHHHFINKNLNLDSNVRHQRVASLESNFKPGSFNGYKEENEIDDDDDVEEREDEKNEFIDSSYKIDSVAHSLNDLKLEKKRDTSRQISDYNKFLFDDDEDQEEEEDEQDQENTKENTSNTKSIQTEEEYDKTLVIETLESPTSLYEKLPSPIDTLNRKDTTSSEGSYNSIQSEDRFQVGSIRQNSKQSTLNDIRNTKQEQQQTQQKNQKQKQNKQLSSKSSSPPPHKLQLNYPLPPLPDMNMMPPNPMMQMQLQMQMNQMNPMGMNGLPMSPFAMNTGMNPMLYQNTEYYGGFNDQFSNNNNNNNKRQSMMAPDSKRMSMMNMNDYSNKRNSMPIFNQQQIQQRQQQQQDHLKTLDPVILKKIEEFKSLRSEISSGNKSMEYRLLWAKMLINSTNFKLYNYITIKGDYLNHKQQPSANKAIFIKSSVTHISKIIKEIESSSSPNDLKSSLKCKAFFIMACLLKNDFVEPYGQDFGISKNIEKSIEFFNKVLNLNSKDSRVLYKLGEIYEYEMENSKDLAIEYYSNSSQFGYGKAVDKLAKFGISIESI
ncbi:uncharacterized protein KGF55_002545 [Candida pseudojiufengensis]|uniref:uncharacterized protein n=1 Tax=Candida pseudojiufengensis TaxID=497109 RepID=UPI0022240BDA|nr:uncharacterized protein KGF55_002545 [Candida pseudojiufengensis]KAI5963665.1 hypothetical protein KGF55_002545 [Candida pseudojiufengensis]